MLSCFARWIYNITVLSNRIRSPANLYSYESWPPRYNESRGTLQSAGQTIGDVRRSTTVLVDCVGESNNPSDQPKKEPMANKNETNDKAKLKKKKYEKELRRLQAELCKLQDWVKHKGLRVIIVFGGATAPAREAPSGPSPSG